MDIDENEYEFWLALQRAKGLGAIGKKKLLDIYSSPRQIFSAQARELREHGLKKDAVASICQPDWKKIEADLAWLQHDNHHLVVIDSKVYPPLLKQIPDPPVVLFARGQLDILQGIQIAVVGSRNPDVSGRKIADELTRELVAAGATITSGLAIGIDSCSHTAALDAGGRTIAVMGNGLDTVYPSSNKDLAMSMEIDNLLISEFPPGVKPLASNFPQRNRIISGMSVGVLVVQATSRSGSLITANYAMEQGREVFAVPGSIRSPLVKGCHSLIKQGAKLVESSADIVEELGALAAAVVANQDDDKVERDGAELDPEHQLLLDNISYDPISIDKLVELTGLTVDRVSSMLLILELRGLVIAEAGAVYVRAG